MANCFYYIWKRHNLGRKFSHNCHSNELQYHSKRKILFFYLEKIIFCLHLKNATLPTFLLSYENNSTGNSSATTLGYTRLFYLDMYTQADGIYTPMTLKITTNETSVGSSIPAASICLVKVLYVGQNIPCMIQTLYNQDQSPFIMYSSRFIFKLMCLSSNRVSFSFLGLINGKMIQLMYKLVHCVIINQHKPIVILAEFVLV